MSLPKQMTVEEFRSVWKKLNADIATLAAIPERELVEIIASLSYGEARALEARFEVALAFLEKVRRELEVPKVET